jgi:hypothetical protein
MSKDYQFKDWTALARLKKLIYLQQKVKGQGK